VGAKTPTPARGVVAARGQPRGTPAQPAPAVRPAGIKAGGNKTAGKKAAKSSGAGAGVPPDQPPGRGRCRRKARRRWFPRTAAVGVTAVSVGGEAPKYADIMRQFRVVYPDLKSSFGIKEVRPKRWSPLGDPKNGFGSTGEHVSGSPQGDTPRGEGRQGDPAEEEGRPADPRL